MEDEKTATKLFDDLIKESVDDEKTAAKLFEDFIKVLIKAIFSDIEKGKGVSPEFIREIRECIKTLYRID